METIDSFSRYQDAIARLQASDEDGGKPSEPALEVLPSFPLNFPVVKQIPGTRFVVDGFRSAGSFSVSYFLSHFHSDHYTGITPLWNKGLIFCSQITASLVVQVLNVADALVVSLPMGETIRIDGVDVILVEANHCPGAVQFLFRVPKESSESGSQECHRYVHTGDMRYASCMKEDASLGEFVGADAVFLDTTYCNPKFIFPSQKESVDYVADTVFRLMQGGDHDGSECNDKDVEGLGSPANLQENTGDGEEQLDTDPEGVHGDGTGDEPGSIREAGMVDDDDDVYDIARRGVTASCNKSTLFLISTYVIGKEKILTAVAKQCGCLLYVTERKLSILKCLNLEDMGIFTTDPTATNVHIVGWSFLGETWPYFRANFGNMEKFVTESGFSRVVGFVPTGWTYELKKRTFSVRRKGSCQIHLVPYSEHSNYDELREYIGFLRPKEIIPTVGLEGGGMDGKAVAAMRKHFRNLVDETASKKKFLKFFNKKVVEETDLALDKQVSVQEKLDIEQPDISASKENGDVKGFPTPRAAFGRLARKRRRDSDYLFSDAREDEEVLTSSGSQIVLQLKPREARECDGQHGRDLSSSSGFHKTLPIQELEPKNDLVLSLDTSQEMEGSLRAILPTWVTQEQAKRLLRQANWDVNAAVAEFYEREMDLMDESISGHQIVTALKQEDFVDLKPFLSMKQNELEKEGLSPSTSAIKESKLGTGPQAKPSGKKKTKAASKAPTSKVKSRPRSSTKAGKNGKSKATKAVPMPSGGKKQAAQPTILTFFKKVGKELTPTALESPQIDSDGVIQTEAMDACSPEGDEADSANLNDKDMEIEALKVATPLMVSSELDKVLTLTASIAEYTTEMNAEKGLSKASDGLSQLMLILDGSVGTDEAQRLLQRVNGDVCKALDLHYNRKLECKGGQTLPCETISIGGAIEAAASHHEFRASSSVAKESEFSFASKEVVMGDLEVSKPGPLDSTVDPLDFPLGSSKLLLSAERNELVSNPDLGSIAISVGNYNPIDHACWKSGEAAPYVHLARSFDLVEHESGRLKTTDMLCNMFRSLLALSPEDILPAIYLATNRIAPDFENTDLNIGGSTVAAAISEATGTPRAKLRDMYNTMGDLGDVAQACRQNQSMLRPPPALRIRQVFATLHQISKESGSGSGARKKSLVLGLIRACREKETKYIVRTLVQNMRIGAMMRTVLPALAQAVVFHKTLPFDRPTDKAHECLKTKLQEASTAAVEAYNFLPNLDLLVPKLIAEGAEGLSASISVRVGTPIKPMLAKITNGIPEVMKKFQGRAFSCEYKYDGQRAQIHLLPDGSIRIFSRNGEDNTSRFPDVSDTVRNAMQPQAHLFIIDAEVVAVDRENGNKLMAFQHLSTRERGAKDGSTVQNIKVEVCVFLFDIMLANEESLVKCSLRERRNYMHVMFPNVKPGYFQYASEITVEAEDSQPDATSTAQTLEVFLDEAFGASCEGLMAKALDNEATYMASKRSDSWLKVKRDYVEGLHDSLDLVPIGAWHGNGRKAGWYSPFLVACYNPDQEEYQSVCRVMSGFSDTFYQESKGFYSGERLLSKKPVYYQTREECDVWFSAEVVWEIRGADLTISPVHQAGIGLVHPHRGISMRFPRFISARTDKKPEDASSPSDIADLFNRQTRKLNVSGMGIKEKEEDSE